MPSAGNLFAQAVLRDVNHDLAIHGRLASQNAL
jgi:hypothetical protein